MNLVSSMTLLLLVILTIPILMAILNTQNHPNFPHYAKTMLFYSFLISMFIYSNQEVMISNWHWTTIQTLKMSLSFKLDFFSMLFMPVALFVTWSILEFSMWYMSSDLNINPFFKYLLMFLITMLILVTANNLFQLFIGWEGVGIMSFLLIGWWYGWADANTAALQAILCDRIGDVGLILSMAWFLTNSDTWELQQIFFLNLNTTSLPLMGLLL